MSQILQALINLTGVPITYLNYNGSPTPTEVTLLPGTMFRTNDLFHVPDNSNPCEYWAKERSEIVNDQNGNTTIFTFWDDDHQDYIIFYVNGANCKSTPIKMNGGGGGNGANVGILITENPSGQFQISALPLINV